MSAAFRSTWGSPEAICKLADKALVEINAKGAKLTRGEITSIATQSVAGLKWAKAHGYQGRSLDREAVEHALKQKGLRPTAAPLPPASPAECRCGRQEIPQPCLSVLAPMAAYVIRPSIPRCRSGQMGGRDFNPKIYAPKSQHRGHRRCNRRDHDRQISRMKKLFGRAHLRSWARWVDRRSLRLASTF